MIAKNNYYFTLGQRHSHQLPSGELWDKHGVLHIIANDEDDAMDYVSNIYGNEWSSYYTDETLDIQYFPKGIIKAINLND